jgi:hypothetical protein
MRTVLLLILLSISVLSFTTCKRYPEGGWSNVAMTHLFGKNLKGASKTWHLKKYEINGIDSTSFITPGNGYTSFENDEVVFKIPEDSKSQYRIQTKVYNCGFHFSSPKLTLELAVGRYIAGIHYLQCYNGVCERNILNPFDLTEEMDWKIQKLTRHELIITITQNNNNYKISLTS